MKPPLVELLDVPPLLVDELTPPEDEPAPLEELDALEEALPPAAPDADDAELDDEAPGVPPPPPVKPFTPAPSFPLKRSSDVATPHPIAHVPAAAIRTPNRTRTPRMPCLR